MKPTKLKKIYKLDIGYGDIPYVYRDRYEKEKAMNRNKTPDLKESGNIKSSKMEDQKGKGMKDPQQAVKEITGMILTYKPGDQNNILSEVRQNLIEARKKQIDELHKDAEILKDLLGGL